MALVLADRVRETTTTAGTGAVSLGGAVSGFQSFSTAIGDANNTYYTIADSNTGAWEVGIGTYTSSGNTLSRDTVLSSSNAGNLVSFAANAKDVFVTQPAERAVYLDTATNATVPGLTVNGTQTISDNSASDALRITQTGTGNALLIEDSANPDSTPFVVDNSGFVVVGTTARLTTQGTSLLQTTTTSAGASFGANRFSSTSSGAEFNFAKSDSDTIGTNTIVASGDILGLVSWSGADGSSYIRAASITAQVDGTPGTNDMPGRLVFSTTADGASSPTEAMRIGSSGTIGVGVTNAAAYTIRTGKNITGGTSGGNFYASGTVQSDVTSNGYGFLAENKTAAASFTLGNFHGFRASQGTFGAGSTVTNQYGFNADSTLTGATNNYGFYSNIASGTGRWNFYANGTAANYFAGNVGIGTTSLSALLTINSETDTTAYNGSATDGQLTAGATQLIRAAAGANTNVAQLVFQSRASQPFNRIVSSGGTAPFMAFATNNAERARIDSSGNVGIGTSSPAQKLHVLADTSGALFQGATLGGVTFLKTGQIGMQLFSDATGTLKFYDNNAGATQLTLASGNLGLGVTPSAWTSTFKTLQLGGGASLSGRLASASPNDELYLSANAYNDGTNWVYINTAAATQYYQDAGTHVWRTAASGTAGNAITFTQAMTLTAAGDLGVGATSPAARLDLGTPGNVRFINAENGVDANFRATFSSNTVTFANTGGSGVLAFQTGGSERARIDSSGNLLVNTTSAVSGSKLVVASADATIYGLTVGRGAGAVATNTAVGASALAANTSGANQTVVGSGAAASTTTGTANTVVGRVALNANTTGSSNVAIGYQAMQNSDGVSNNTAVGTAALLSNVASHNTAVGYQAGYSNTTGTQQTFIGYQAGNGNTTGNYNTFVGYIAGYQTTTGTDNTFVGNGAGSSHTTGSSNGFFGTGAGNAVTTGGKNTIVGRYSGNQGGLDIRTASNYIVLSDGDGNPKAWWDAGYNCKIRMGSGAGTNTMKYNTSTYEVTYDTSSARYKDNIRDSVYGLSHVMQMRSAQFEYKDGGRTDIGLIAEELDPIIPELVGKDADGRPDSVTYDRMVSVLVKAIQELKSELDSVKAELATLKGA